MSKFFCITDLIWFVIKEAEKLMNVPVHQDNLFIVHDALVLMTVKGEITRMKDKNYLHSWLLSINGLQDGTTYAAHPVGNSP